MNNEQLIRAAHGWAIAIILAAAIVAGATQMSFNDRNSILSGQNQNSNNNARKSSSTKAKNQNDSPGDASATMTALTQADRKFMNEAAMGGMMEVELGRVAAQQGSSNAVKQFGQRMIDDHSKANTELATLATSKGLTLPTELDAAHKANLAKFSKMTGAAFDRAYAKEMLKDHTKDVAEFEQQSTRAGDADLKTFVSKTLPTLREHLDMAKSLNGMSASRRL